MRLMAASFNQVAEADIFGRYLIGESPNPASKKLYQKVIQTTNYPLSATDKRLINFGLRHHWSIGLIDSGLVIIRPEAEFRRRLYVMLAVLESSPDYAHHFLSRKRSPLYLLVMAWIGIRAVVKTILGVILVKALSKHHG